MMELCITCWNHLESLYEIFGTTGQSRGVDRF